MNKRECLHKCGVQSQCIRNGTGDLRNFDGVRQAITKMIGETHGKNLGFGFQAAKGPRVNNTIAVANIVIAVRMRRLSIATAPRILHIHCPWHAARQAMLSFDEKLRWVRSRDCFVHLTILERPPGNSQRANKPEIRPQDFGARVPRPRSASSEIVESGNSCLIC